MTAFEAGCERLDYRKILHQIAHYAPSELGREAVEHLLPTDDLATLSVEHNRVSELKKMIESETAFPIDGIKDIRLALNRAAIENNTLSPQELLDVASTLRAGNAIRQFVEKRREYYPELSSLTHLLWTDKVLTYNISQAIDENGAVKDSASKELRAVRQSIISIHAQLSKRLEKILRDVSEQGMAQEDIITTREGRMVLPIKTERKNMVPGFIHSASASGLTVYIEPAETLALNNEISELHFREKREIEKVLRSLTQQVSDVRVETRENVRLLTIIEFTYAKAKYSIDIKGNKPYLIENGSLVVRHGRHPLLMQKHGREGVVPLNIELGGAYSTLLITGPNAGGKTVALKTVGLLALMVQSGIHIPASADSEFPVYRKIFVNIGDNQSIEDDLSTYSSQMLQLKEIVEGADDRSLVLIDEIGAGTDPTEGSAIAASLLRALTESGAMTIATTHHGSLKAFAHETPGMQNGAMEFNQASLQPTYRFRVGVPGSSYALVIARRLGMPEQVLRDAQEMLGEQQSKLERLLLELEQRSQDAENERQMLASERSKNMKLSEEYETKLAHLKKEVREVKAKALRDAQEIVDRANASIEHAVREIRAQNAEKETVKKWRSQIGDLDNEIREESEGLKSSEPEASRAHTEFFVGDDVQLVSNGQMGKVLTRPDAQGNLTVAFNTVKMKVNVNQLSTSRSASKPVEESSSYFIKPVSTTEVDLRGMYGDEAIEIVDKFLDDAVIGGLRRIDIIHGKGTGALRKRIHEFLKEDKRVKSFKLGEWNEGGTGVTVVELH
ncbi:MAG TPA: endonuclease MutS2 [Bacteroidota bacterium]|nr:endonuclease MutS2 [Bacteroidota bacterium]